MAFTDRRDSLPPFETIQMRRRHFYPNKEIPAQRIFRRIGDVSMAMALEQLLHVQEKLLLTAQVSVLLGRFDLAEEMFLKSSKPQEALMVSLPDHLK